RIVEQERVVKQERVVVVLVGLEGRQRFVTSASAEIGVFGGSGFYAFLDDVNEVVVNTPYGPPSAPVAIGDLEGRRVAFLARHGPSCGRACCRPRSTMSGCTTGARSWSCRGRAFRPGPSPTGTGRTGGRSST